MKTIFKLLFFFPFVFFANEKDFFDSANVAYSKNNFDLAIKYYEKIVKNDFEVAEVYYNLGNAYYKTNQIGLAILNYERALKINPDNEDAKFNLRLANQKIIDKINAIPQIFISEWKDRFFNTYSEKGWSLVCIILLSLSLIFFAIYLSLKKIFLKQAGFWLGCLFFTASLMAFFVAKNQYELTTRKKEAIVISYSVNVTSSPAETGTKIFVLHEGTKISIIETLGDWAKIKIENGNVGWIKTSEIVFI